MMCNMYNLYILMLFKKIAYDRILLCRWKKSKVK